VPEVRFLREADAELNELPAAERVAMRHAVEKLRALGTALPFPHQSSVIGADQLRELRPRAGRSPWRALYRQISDEFVVGAVAPEAKSNRRGFSRAVQAAETRLARYVEAHLPDES
jgi:hypothetical protein